MPHIFDRRKFVNIQGGMTYVELIVVLTIFSIISAVTIFDYGKFQDRVEIKNLVNDIALTVVEAQRSALAGKLYSPAGSTWKPAYGVYFNEGVTTNAEFNYFADLNNNGTYDATDCTSGCIKTIGITNGSYISNLDLIGTGTCVAPVETSIVFTRPDASAIITTLPPNTSCIITYAEVAVTSNRGVSSTIRIYPSGRVQIH